MRRQPTLLKPSGGKDTNRVRIIGGRWRGRKLAFPDGEGLRPTGDRIRETLFNWLAPMLPDARCLDLFAGSGALGFEALSRGAASCLMVERNPSAIRSLQEAKQALGADSATILAFDSQSWLQQASGTFDLVFIDPPFADTTLRPEVLVRRLRDLGLLENDVWIYVEQPSDDPALPPEGFTMHRSQLAGNVRYSIWRAE